MKSQLLQKVLLLVFLILTFNINPSYCQDYIISQIGNIHDNSSTIKPGNIVRLTIKSDDFIPLSNKVVFLYINGVKSDIQAFEKNAADKFLYFHLQEESLGKMLAEKPELKTRNLSFSIGFETGVISNSSKVLIEYSKNTAKLKYNSLDLNGLLAVKILDETRFYQLKNKQEPLMLYLNHILMDSSHLVGFDDDQFVVTFSLESDEVHDLFYRQKSKENLILGIGTEESNLITVTDKLKINFFTLKDRIFSWGIIVAMLIFLLILSSNTDLIRDIGTYSINGDRPFSFARTQLAFWSFIIISSFIFIWFTTNELAFFPNSALVLLGISVTVTAAGRAIDSKISPTKKLQLKPFRKMGKDSVKDMVFFREILSDGGGLSIHRFQYFAFNLFLGIVFARDVYYNLEMSTFSTELLSMMGISATAYAGIKGFEGNSVSSSKQNTETVIHSGEDNNSESVAG